MEKQQPTLMSQFSVVLVRSEGDGNVGQAARAMRNFGLREMILVQPQFVETELCKCMAAGSYHLVRDAKRIDNLQEALADFHFVIGFSRRLGKFRKRFATSRALPGWLLPQMTGGQRTALVFGNEVSGLDKSELDLCNQLVEIVADSNCGSLNLAQAVLVILYELYSHVQETSLQVTEREPASHDIMQRLLNHMRRIYLEIGFFDKNNPARTMRQLRRLYARIAPTQGEVMFLHGILQDTEWYINHVAETGVRDGYREVVGNGESGD